MMSYAFLIFFLLASVCGAQSAPVAAPTTAPAPVATAVGIDAKLVEKALRGNRFAYLLFALTKKELEARRFSEAKVKELSAKIYWEIMSEYATAYTKENLTADDVNCVIQAYEMPEAEPINKIIAPAAYAQEFKETVLNKKTWVVGPNAPNEKQVESIILTTGLVQQIIANIAQTLKDNNLKSTKETIEPIYKKIIVMFRSLALQNGSTEKSLKKFVDQIEKPACQKFFKVNIRYSNKRKLNLITDRIPK